MFQRRGAGKMCFSAIQWLLRSTFCLTARRRLRRGKQRPSWLKVRFRGGENFKALDRIMRTLELHTVCESARCPNMGECWEHRTATFMILGDICTRACGFCAVPSGKPAGSSGGGRAGARGRSRGADGIEVCGGHVGESRRSARRRRGDFRAHDRGNPRARAGLQSGSADSGFSRQLGRAREGDGRAAGRAESQYGNCAAAVSPRAQGRGLRTVA